MVGNYYQLQFMVKHVLLILEGYQTSFCLDKIFDESCINTCTDRKKYQMEKWALTDRVRLQGAILQVHRLPCGLNDLVNMIHISSMIESR